MKEFRISVRKDTTTVPNSHESADVSRRVRLRIVASVQKIRQPVRRFARKDVTLRRRAPDGTTVGCCTLQTAFLMTKSALFLLSLLLPLSASLSAQAYRPDVLGPPYESRTFVLAPDGEDTPPVCTLVRRQAPAGATTALLYVHGYNDYFFQSALGDSAAAHGYAFYAIDLHDYGRSIRRGRDPFYAADLRDYHADLDSALAEVRGEGYGRIVLMGHSTGGLIAADYAQERGPRAGLAALVLNSPFLDWNFGPLLERVVIPTVSGLGRLFPRWKVQGEGVDTYARSLLHSERGEWDFDTQFKPIEGIPLYFSWLRAVRNGQRRIKRGLNIAVPVLVMSSDRSYFGTEWNDALFRTDAVLNVEDIRRYAPNLGSDVTYAPIAGGMHDLFLSSAPVRAEAFRTMFEWLDRTLPAATPDRTTID